MCIVRRRLRLRWRIVARWRPPPRRQKPSARRVSRGDPIPRTNARSPWYAPSCVIWCRCRASGIARRRGGFPPAVVILTRKPTGGWIRPCRLDSRERSARNNSTWRTGGAGRIPHVSSGVVVCVTTRTAGRWPTRSTWISSGPMVSPCDTAQRWPTRTADSSRW